jgi:hypothetical protein
LKKNKNYLDIRKKKSFIWIQVSNNRMFALLGLTQSETKSVYTEIQYAKANIEFEGCNGYVKYL